jgi:hypothetical protein
MQSAQLSPRRVRDLSDEQTVCVDPSTSLRRGRVELTVGDTVGEMDGLVVFVGALVGAVLGAYGELTLERLRGRRALELQRLEDVERGLLNINEHATAALRICADLRASQVRPALYGADWRELRARQLPDRAAEMLVALARVDLFLSDGSAIEQRVNDYFDVLVALPTETGESDEQRLALATEAHAHLKVALRDELSLTTTSPGGVAALRRLGARWSTWPGRVSSYLGRGAGE